MLSIKSFLDLGRVVLKKSPDVAVDTSTERLHRALSLLVEAIAVHAVNWDPLVLEGFQISVRKFRTDLTEAPVGADPLFLAAEVISALKSYNQDAERFMTNLANELQSIIKAVTDTLLLVHQSSETAAASLRNVQGQIEQTVQLDSLRTVKTQLVSSLLVLREEAARQRSESEDLTSQMRKTLARSILLKSGEHEPRTDPVTGLPSRRGAMEVMTGFLAARKPAFLGVFRLERFTGINEKFGFDAGDQVLRLFAQHVRKRLGSTDQLFRWRGPLFVAILDLDTDLHIVSTMVSSIATARMEKEVEIGSRTVVLPVVATWTVISLADSQSAEEISDKIDAFLLGNSSP